jgi:hypothetical protein
VKLSVYFLEMLHGRTWKWSGGKFLNLPFLLFFFFLFCPYYLIRHKIFSHWIKRKIIGQLLLVSSIFHAIASFSCWFFYLILCFYSLLISQITTYCYSRITIFSISRKVAIVAELLLLLFTHFCVLNLSICVYFPFEIVKMWNLQCLCFFPFNQRIAHFRERFNRRVGQLHGEVVVLSIFILHYYPIRLFLFFLCFWITFYQFSLIICKLVEHIIIHLWGSAFT